MNTGGRWTQKGKERSPIEMEELKDKARTMYVIEKMSLRRIGKVLGLSATTVSRWHKKYEWDRIIGKAENEKEKALLRELKGQLDKPEEVDAEYVIHGLKRLAEGARAETVQLGAYKALGESLGMFDSDMGDEATQDVIELHTKELTPPKDEEPPKKEEDTIETSVKESDGEDKVRASSTSTARA